MIQPERMYLHKGTYYLVNKDSKWLNLGKSLTSAIAEYHRLVPSQTSIKTMGELIDRYMIEISPTKAESTYKGEIQEAKLLRAAFGEMYPRDVTPVVIYEYMDFRSQTAPVRVNREVALLSHMFKKAMRWGLVESNPCRDVERNPERPRHRYVTNDELLAFKSIVPEWLSLYIDLKSILVKSTYSSGQINSEQHLVEFSNYLERLKAFTCSVTERGNHTLAMDFAAFGITGW